MRYVLCAVAVILLVVLLSFQNQLEENTEIPFDVVVNSGNTDEAIKGWRTEENAYFVFLPSYADPSKVYLQLKEGNQLILDEKEISDGITCQDFEIGVPNEVCFRKKRKESDGTITLLQSANLASCYIDTESGGVDFVHAQKGNSETALARFYNEDGSLNYSGTIDSIKGRGNYTWEAFSKKAYSLTFHDAANLLGMGMAQRWVLLANAADPSHLRNKIVYDYAAEFGLEYSPDTEWLDLYINGEYVGLYLLSERNEIHSERIDIPISNSFLVSTEVEARLIAQEYPFVKTASGQALRIFSPEKVTDYERKWIGSLWQSAENAILAENNIDSVSGKHLSELIDVESWARKYLIEEVFGNVDACYISQYYYYTTNGSDSRIFAGPVWDYDLSIGTQTEWQLRNPRAFFANWSVRGLNSPVPWAYYLYQKPEFQAAVIELYEKEFAPLLKNWLVDRIDEYSKQVLNSVVMDHVRWSNACITIEDITVQCNYIKQFLHERMDFLDDIWLNKEKYCLIRVYGGEHTSYAYYAVQSGNAFDALPVFDDTEYQSFVGWYYEDGNEPFDPTRPIYEDIAVYAKWQDTPYKRYGQIAKLTPLGIIALLFMVIFIADVKRMRKDR